MGKTEEEQGLGSSEPSWQNAETQLCPCPCTCWFDVKRIRRLIGLRCIAVFFLSLALLLSALFWLPPFLQFADQSDLDLDPKFRDHSIVASFNLLKPVSLLEDNVLQLEDNIFDEIVTPSTKVVILSLESLGGLNEARVVFGVDPEPKSSKLLSTSESLIRESFEYLVTHQSLSLNASLFGPTSFFEVLKFPGGITIIPPQKAFLLQKVQILFNFTLNYSIHQIQLNFNELKSQLKSGLRLAPYENLYVKLSNSKGSTVTASTTVQSSVLLTIGTPSMQRLKQLAQTITHSYSRNLGLNNTVFGKVKQVRLSSILQHSLNGGDGTAWSPSPAPLPDPHAEHNPEHHHRHHHHHHHHHQGSHLAPAFSPAPATGSGLPASPKGAPGPDDHSPKPQKSLPAPEKSCKATPPSSWSSRRGKAGKQYHLYPVTAPSVFGPSPQNQGHLLGPISRLVPASSPLPHVVFAHVLPPSKSDSDSGRSYTGESPGPSPSTSASAALRPCVQWPLSLFLALVLQLLQERTICISSEAVVVKAK